MQATVYRFDAGSGSGSLLTDDGAVLAFDVDAARVSGLRHLRIGQRLTVETDGTRVTALRLGTIGVVPPPSPG